MPVRNVGDEDEIVVQFDIFEGGTLIRFEFSFRLFCYLFPKQLDRKQHLGVFNFHLILSL